MGEFLDAEKQRQSHFKATSAYFTQSARSDGTYRGRPRPFALPVQQADENLFDEVREASLDYFGRNGIRWHDGQNHGPSNHLCSSQVQCVNFLYAFIEKPNALINLLKPVFPAIQSLLPMESPGQFVSFEWIGLQNYLGERMRPGTERTRGANFTSADAAVKFQRSDGLRQIVLIEWKYTESYAGNWLGIAPSGTSRMEIYRHLYEHPECPLDKSSIHNFGDLFYEPFYQLMRQQFLAWKMEQAKELCADVVSVLHIAPTRNHDFRKVTSSALRPLGESVINVWKKLVKNPGRFVSISTEELFGRLADNLPSELTHWWQYVRERYPWVQA
jgi:hypothetical protein